MMLIQRGMGKRYEEIDNGIIRMLVDGTEQMSAADLCKMCEHIKRRTIINPKYTITSCAIREYCEFVGVRTKEQKVTVCKALKNNCKRYL